MKCVVSTIIIVCMLICAGCMAAAQTGNFSAGINDEPVVVPGSNDATIQASVQLSTPIPFAEQTPVLATTAPEPVQQTPEETPGQAPELTSQPISETIPSATPEIKATPTPTPKPTKTPKPTPTYEVTKIDAKEAYLNAGSANFRKGPGLDYKIIRELKEGAKLTVVGKSGDWLKVEYKDETGFILAEFVEYGSKDTPTPTKTPKPTASPKPTATPRPTATPKNEPTTAPEPTQEPVSTSPSTSSLNASDYFSAGGGFTAEELLLIAQVVHEESKSDDVEARAAVANSIYNRIISPKFPNSVEGVIFQKNQYTVARDEEKIRAVKPSSKTIQAVNQIFVEGNRFLPEDILYFRSARLGTEWAKRTYYATFGGNAFFY